MNQKPLLFTPFSQDDFLPGNYGIEHLNDVLWTLIENVNLLSQNKEEKTHYGAPPSQKGTPQEPLEISDFGKEVLRQYST
jgi:hypothetical protein